MEKAVGVLRLIRPVNCIVMGFAVFVGIIVAIPGFSLEKSVIIKIVLGFTTGFTFLATANVVNDYYDRKIDAVNEPHRPIPSGIIRPKEALGYASILSVIGFVASFLTNFPCLILASTSWVLLLYYNTKGKHTGLLGNLVVSGCIALPFIYGGFAVERWLSLVLILYSAMAFLLNTGREVTKGISDMQGDRLQGIKTTAVLHGAKAAAVTATFFYLIAVGLSSLPWILGEVSVWYLPVVASADAGFLFSSFSLLHNPSRENSRRVKNMVRVCMVISLLAFIAGKFGRMW